MKVLHLFSNWKVTGPAESVMLLVGALRARGVDALFASGENPFGGENLVEMRGTELGLDVIRKWHLRKHFESFRANWQDAAAIRRFIENENVDIVHCHMINDHHIGGLAAKKAKKPVPVVRSIYEPGALPLGIRNRLILPRLTDAIIAFSDKALSENKRIFSKSIKGAYKIDPSVDLVRLNPRRVRKNPREYFKLPAGKFVLGVVGRIQRKRGFDILLDAVRRAREVVGDFTLFVVGRGTKIEDVLFKPAKKLGISEMIVHAGYLSGQDFVDAFGAMDAEIFLGGGTDRTAPAVRQAMAMGKPVIAAKSEMLPELVMEGETGLLVDLKAEDVAYAICRFARDELMRIRMSRKARAYARDHFDLDEQALKVREIYKKVLEKT